MSRAVLFYLTVANNRLALIERRKEMTDAELRMKYFVLKPGGKDAYAQASRRAMWIFANIIKDENPMLAKELKSWVEAEEERNGIQNTLPKNSTG
jgi:hypothetical protein